MGSFSFLRNIKKDQRGQAVVEYILLLMIVVGMSKLVSSKVLGFFDQWTTAVMGKDGVSAQMSTGQLTSKAEAAIRK